MRRLLLALLVACSLPSGAPAAQRTPALRVASMTPLTLHGAGFAPKERVRVRLVLPRRQTRWIRAARNGTFRARFSAPADRCNGLDARARGDDGSRARLKVQPLCPPA